MINFTEGKIQLDGQNIFIKSNLEELKLFEKKGLIEERKEAAGKPYFYFKAAEDTIRFDIFLNLEEAKIQLIVLRWLDRPMKSWDDISEKALSDEYHLLLNLVERNVGRPPDKRKNRKRTWQFNWGEVEVSYEPRSFDAAIFMVPHK